MFKRIFLYLAIHIYLLGALAHSAETYDKKARAEYYASTAFQKALPNFCHFKTDLIATYRREIPSIEIGQKMIQKVANFSEKAKWHDEIIAARSYIVFPGNTSMGMVYHFEYKNKKKFLFNAESAFNDYYKEIQNKDHFRGCIVYTSTPLKNADFDYKLIQDKDKVYLQRTARITLKIPSPTAIAKKELEKSNKETLDEFIKYFNES